MADQFQIPQYNPGQPQFIDPTAMINELYNRPKPAEIAANSLNQGVSNLYNQYVQQQGLKAKAFEAGGPYLMQMLYGQGQPQTGAPSVGQPSSNNTPPAAEAPGGAMPGNYGPQSQPSAPTLLDPSGGSAPQVPATIQAHMDMFGHPNYAAMAGNPNLGVHAQRIQQLQGQMGQNAQMGAYGQKLNQGVNDQLGAEKALMEGEQFNVGQQRQQQQFQQGQDAEESRFQRSQNKQESQFQRGKVAEETGKQTQTADETRQLRGLYGDLQTAMSQTPPSLTGNMSGKLAEMTGGRIGSKEAQNMLNASNPLATALNTVLSRRFNSGEVQMLSNALIPQPKDLPDVREQKMQRLGQMISTMEQGNEQNIRNVAQAVTGGIPSIGGPTKTLSQAPSINSQQQYDALPNGTPYTWNGQPHVKGRS